MRERSISCIRALSVSRPNADASKWTKITKARTCTLAEPTRRHRKRPRCDRRNAGSQRRAGNRAGRRAGGERAGRRSSELAESTKSRHGGRSEQSWEHGVRMRWKDSPAAGAKQTRVTRSRPPSIGVPRVFVWHQPWFQTTASQIYHGRLVGDYVRRAKSDNHTWMFYNVFLIFSPRPIVIGTTLTDETNEAQVVDICTNANKGIRTGNETEDASRCHLCTAYTNRTLRTHSKTNPQLSGQQQPSNAVAVPPCATTTTHIILGRMARGCSRRSHLAVSNNIGAQRTRR